MRRTAPAWPSAWSGATAAGGLRRQLVGNVAESHLEAEVGRQCQPRRVAAPALSMHATRRGHVWPPRRSPVRSRARSWCRRGRLRSRRPVRRESASRQPPARPSRKNVRVFGLTSLNPLRSSDSRRRSKRACSTAAASWSRVQSSPIAVEDRFERRHGVRRAGLRSEPGGRETGHRGRATIGCARTTIPTAGRSRPCDGLAWLRLRRASDRVDGIVEIDAEERCERARHVARVAYHEDCGPRGIGGKRLSASGAGPPHLVGLAQQRWSIVRFDGIGARVVDRRRRCPIG